MRTTLLAIAFCCLAAAQTTDATVSGDVTDPAGAAVLGAHVTARNMNTGGISHTSSNAAGVYVFGALQPGPYQVTAETTGFQKYVVNDLILDVCAKAALNLELKLGATFEWTPSTQPTTRISRILTPTSIR